MPEKPTVPRERPTGLGRIIEKPMLYPASCLVTGRGDGPVIDLLKDFHPGHEGRMYIRVQVAKDLGVLVGMKTPEELEALTERIKDLEADVSELTEQRDRAQNALDAIAALENTGFVVRHTADPAIAATAAD